MTYGILTLLPPALVIFLAIKTKRPIESLLIGCLASYAIISFYTGQDFISMAAESFSRVVTDYDNMYIVCVCALFGSLIALLNASRGTTAFAKFVGKVCKGEKSVSFMAWLLGVIIFIDDYMNIMTISSCMKKSCDEKTVPRASLAYIIDSTGAPACVLVPFSTWAVFYATNFYEQEAVRNLNFGSGMSSYLHAVPYMFYASLALIITLLFCLKLIPALGPMKKEYEEIGLKEMNKVEDNKNLGHLIDFVVPLGVMIAVTVVLDNMFIALVASIISCFILYIPRKILSANEFCDLWIKGIGDLMPTLMILLFAFYMKNACADLNLPTYVIEICAPYISGNIFPAIAFILVSVLAFVTGDSWGVPAICVPIIIPLAASCGANILLTMGAIVSGGVFCSHACFYSDATVLTATCCDIDPMTHAKTQLPYAIIGFVISFILYFVLGFVM